MSGTSISRRQANKGIDQLEEAGVTDQMFQDVFLAGLLSALGAAVVAGKNIKDDVIALLSGNAVITMVKRLVTRIPFEPTMIGQGWTWWKGPADGDGLEGEEYCDGRSLVLQEVDFCQVLREHCLKEDETSITGHEKDRRLKALTDRLQLDPGFGWALHQEPGQKTLRWLHDTFGIFYLDFFGRILRNPDGRRCVLCLDRCGGGSWVWGVAWLGDGWGRDRVSAALPASSAQVLESQNS